MKIKYDKKIGYSRLDYLNKEKQKILIKINKLIIDDYFKGKIGKILVAGTGFGFEATRINHEFKLFTVGTDSSIDLTQKFINKDGVAYQINDLMTLSFKDDSFSLIYCYHVLEHVKNHKRVLSEFLRVLKPGGVLFIGFPNKNRLISYLGTSQKASLYEKIIWNMNDYLFRIKRKFENKHGAHAGFTQTEFLEDAGNLFDAVFPVRNKYMLLKYSKYKGIMMFLSKTNLAEFFFPSNYFICMRNN